MSAILMYLMLAFNAGRDSRPPGLPNYTHPVAAADRVDARERAWEVYDAIDAATSDPELRIELRRICKRESMCNWIRPVKLHRGETRSMGRKRWKKAVKRGLLHPETCEHHKLGDDPAVWTVNGAFGTATAYVLRHVGECEPPESMYDPYAAARAAVGHMEVLCRRHKACDCQSRVRWWAGPGVWAGRTERHKMRSTTRQCGEQPAFDWIAAYVMDAYNFVTVGAWEQLKLEFPLAYELASAYDTVHDARTN